MYVFRYYAKILKDTFQDNAISFPNQWTRFKFDHIRDMCLDCMMYNQGISIVNMNLLLVHLQRMFQ